MSGPLTRWKGDLRRRLQRPVIASFYGVSHVARRTSQRSIDLAVDAR